ncbi:cytochrome P450 [Dendrothele bispora CBS 962.96]|uniref:Cytochrome P450 n=1 Tax=Dendrothele bispora (strain CBS 962.96) TaxID=1314807 RepID=A0A4S8M7G5_DENBC|nr:cytochrome P450 [Dendrothele bispora CBS 962.96]
MSNLSDYVRVFALSFFIYRLVKSYVDSRTSPLRKIPTVGYSQAILNEGYVKYNGRAFKIPLVTGWQVVVSGPKLIEDIKNAPDDVLSLRPAADEAVQVHHQVGDYSHEPDFYRINAIRSKVTRDIVPRFDDMHDEIQISFAEEIPIKGDEWVSVRFIEAARRIISRTSNRIFVGLPTCQDPAYRDLNIEFAVDIMVCASVLLIFPNFMRPFVSKMISNVPKQLRLGAELLRPVFEERLAKEAEYGKDWPGKPNDLISWLIDATPTSKRTVEELSLQIIIINFGSIHTTSMAFTVVMYYLACHPELHDPLREEINSILEEEGRTKTAMAKMHKLDSVLKESQRLMGNSVAAMNRLCLKDFTFSDGTVVPAGTFVSAASNATHNDENIYPDAHKFNGFRFAEMKSEKGEEMGQNMVKPNNEYMIFGNGKHAW